MRLHAAISLYAGGPGSGCNPEAGKCGRPKTVFHGTAEQFAAQIKQQGLFPPSVLTGDPEGDKVYTSENRDEALKYALDKAEETGASKAVLITIKNPDQAGLVQDLNPGEDTFFIKEGMVDPKYIDKVETYDVKQLMKDIHAKPLSAAAQDKKLHLVFLFND